MRFSQYTLHTVFPTKFEKFALLLIYCENVIIQIYHTVQTVIQRAQTLELKSWAPTSLQYILTVGPEYNNTFFLGLLLNMSNSVIKHLAECWVLSKWMMNGSYSYSYYFMARNFIKVKHLRETKHPQISNSHLFQATFML